ncbi:hypothetical protein [Geomicrobium sediminis]|uniref:Sporulation protein YlmC with PRC-barrel domain n=1 Tax=Geomicrobium sediminis TaxID=1347788 RepID=A0ABS2P9C7_9BACL|nr:hypothetical protein [Geomicrobium sediminis]MBM7632017.1 sporulation protein YlmC with PRC-barrel domain [Geomicrobium sediminis]
MKRWFLLIMSFMLIPSCEDQMSFLPGGGTSTGNQGVNSTYEMKLEQEDDYYRATVSIDVRNHSNDSWNKLLFYFEHFLQPFDIEVTVNGDEAETRQVQSRFAIDLNEFIRPNDRAVVELSYQFYPGEAGSVQAIRPWYPLLGDYVQGEWQVFESNNTYNRMARLAKNHYMLTYDLQGKQVITSTGEKVDESTIEIEDTDVFSTIVMPEEINEIETTVGDTNVLSVNVQPPDVEIALDKIKQLEDIIGPYPGDQLIFVEDEHQTMFQLPGTFVHRTTMQGGSESGWLIYELIQLWYDSIHLEELQTDFWIKNVLVMMTLETFNGGVDAEALQSQMDEEVEYVLPVNLHREDYNNDEFHLFTQVLPRAALWELIEENWQDENVQDAPKQFLSEFSNEFMGKQISTEDVAEFLCEYFAITEEELHNYIVIE